jgi:hypothetical protein
MNPSTTTGTGWQERFLVGSKELEDRLIKERFVPEINRIQRDISHIKRRPGIKRAQHGKLLVGTTNAEFHLLPDLPAELTIGLFQPGKSYTTHVRFSNAASVEQPDMARDLRGVALRVKSDSGQDHDFLMTNAPYSHARDARQFMIISSALVRVGHPALLWRFGPWRTIVGLVRIAGRLGIKEMLRVLRTLREQTSRPVASLATEHYWSRAPFAFGSVAIKFKLAPTASTSATSDGAAGDLRQELISRLTEGAVRFDFRVQKYVDDEKTPIEDGTIEWKEQDAPFITIARLVIPKQQLDASEEQKIDSYAFNPWNTGFSDIRPLGSMNRARKLVYSASAGLRDS